MEFPWGEFPLIPPRPSKKHVLSSHGRQWSCTTRAPRVKRTGRPHTTGSPHARRRSSNPACVGQPQLHQTLDRRKRNDISVMASLCTRSASATAAFRSWTFFFVCSASAAATAFSSSAFVLLLLLESAALGILLCH